MFKIAGSFCVLFVIAAAITADPVSSGMGVGYAVLSGTIAVFSFFTKKGQ